MAKDSIVRWDDTIAYLNNKTPFDNLGDHINTVVPNGGARAGISDEISVDAGAKSILSSKEKRRALRGLLLCQRVYYSNLWSKKTWSLGNYVKNDYSLPLNWKTDSLNYWKNKSEQEIIDGILMFVPVQNANRQDLVRVAKAGAPNGIKADFLPGNLFLSRRDQHAKGENVTCYNGVMAWLLLSGICSMRWFMLDVSLNGEESLDRQFGDGAVAWDGSKPFKSTSVTPTITAGHIVHMWKEESLAGGWNGHWVVSNGDGTICGVNNGHSKELGVDKPYTNHSTLKLQWESYGGYLTKDVMNIKTGFLETEFIKPLKYARAWMKEYDPLQIPGMM